MAASMHDESDRDGARKARPARDNRGSDDRGTGSGWSDRVSQAALRALSDWSKPGRSVGDDAVPSMWSGL